MLRRLLLESLFLAASAVAAADEGALERQFSGSIRPLVTKYCAECHGAEEPEAKLDLTRFREAGDVARKHSTWLAVLERVEAGDMPPKDAESQPTEGERKQLVEWIRAFRMADAEKNAGDPGVVPARRLNNAEFNNTIRDLTGHDLSPAKDFPVDPANEAGFDNSAESLAMSPALAKKYVDAARFVGEHLVLKPQGIAFAAHPVMTDTDRDKYCVRRIVDFYLKQPTDYAAYFQAAWRYKYRAALGEAGASLEAVAASEKVSPKYLAMVWEALEGERFEVGPMGKLQGMWRGLAGPGPVSNGDAAAGIAHPTVRVGVLEMRDFVVVLRRKLEPAVKGLKVSGIHEGSQCFVLWKNRQYAANRRTFDRGALVESDSEAATKADANLVVPKEPAERARYEASFAKFCDLFPDAFYVSERGRDYVGKPREQQEKGRLLSAGFHSMMGYFRDDGPLCDMVLSDAERRELDKLWNELDFIANAPARQHIGFLWFERTDSRWLRDEEFDFSRPEHTDCTSEAKIRLLAERYLAKAIDRGAAAVEREAIRFHFAEMNQRIRAVEEARRAAEPTHLAAILEFAERAFRRPLEASEREELLAFYQSLRRDELTHEEAAQDLLVSILLSPRFCYRTDLIIEAGEARRALSDVELASRLSYLLWASTPDEALMAAARRGELRQPGVLAAQARRMLQDERVRGLALEFGGNWLDFRRFDQHNAVDRERFPTFTNELREAMFEEPVRYIVDLVQRDGSVLDFLYGRHTLVNGVLAEHYDLPDTVLGRDEWSRIDDATSAGRGGLLPMAAFLTQNSPGLRTSPVKRGYWVVRRLLGERIPAPPPNVPELPADESKLELSLRETLAKHREHASCAGCHERFDSFGLVFEGYGPIGERRERDLGGRPVETAATFPGGANGTGIEGVLAYIKAHREADFVDNLCRKLVSYGLGRTLLPSDDSTIVQMREKLAADGYRFSSLVESIVASPQFLTKRSSGEH